MLLCHLRTVGLYILGVFHEQPRYEVFGQDAGAAEELLIKCVIHSRHVGQSLLLVVTQEGRRAAQTARRDRGGQTWHTNMILNGSGLLLDSKFLVFSMSAIWRGPI